MKYLLLILLMIALVILKAGGGEGRKEGFEKKILQATEFEVTDPTGKARIKLNAEGGIPKLILFDENSKQRALLSVLPSGPTLVMYDENQAARCIIKDRQYILENGNGKINFMIDGEKDVHMSIAKDGIVKSRLGVNLEGNSELYLESANRTCIGVLNVSNKMAAFTLASSDGGEGNRGKSGAVKITAAIEDSNIIVYGPDDKEVWRSK